MGLFGGDSASSLQTNSYVFTNQAGNGSVPSNGSNFNIAGITVQGGKSANGGKGGAGGSGGNGGSTGGTLNLTLTDYGAINAGMELGKAALSSNNQALQQAFTQSAAVVNKTLDIASQNQVSESAQFQQTLIKFAGMAAAVVALMLVMRNG